MATKTLMTVEEFAQMNVPETEDYELVEGELNPLPSATPIHGLICENVSVLIGSYLRGNRVGKVLSEVDCRVGDDTVRRPDRSIFLRARIEQIDPNKVPIPFAPDIAVEVLSPSEIAIDVNRKIRDYLGAGSTEVWILDHENAEVFVHTKAGIRLLVGNDALESPLLPGFAASVNDLLAGF
jgi:Uma2 family endonuclease